MRKAGVCLAVAFLFIMMICPFRASGGGDAASASDWPTFRHDLRRTGYSPESAPDTADIAWSKNLPGAGQFWSSPALYANRLYIGNGDGSLYCVDALTGEVIWRFSTNSFEIYSSPTVAYGMVFFGGPDRQIYALPCDDPNSDGQITTDEVIWNYTVGNSTGDVNNVVCGSPAIDNGNLYLGAIDQYFYCFNATAPGPKTPIWKTYTPFRGQHAFSSSPAIDRCMIFAATGNQPGTNSSGRLYCFNESDGSRVWEFDIGDITYSTPVIDGDRVYIANSGDWVYNAGNLTYRLYCLDFNGFLDGTDDGVPDPHYGNSDLVWSYDTGKYIYSSPALHDGRLYFGSSSGNLTCVDALTGSEIWVCQTPAGGGGEPGGIMGSPAVADGKVFVGTADGRIIAVPEEDPDSNGIIEPGEILWSYNIGGKVVCSPAVANGAVYIGNGMGTLYCFGTPIPVDSFKMLSIPVAGLAAVMIAVFRRKKISALN